MNTETILSRVCAALTLCASDAPERGDLFALRDDLAAQVRKETAASRGVGNAAATIQRMLDGMKKKDGRRALHYAWTDEKGRQCVCDGIRAYRLNEPLPLEPRPDDAGTGIDLSKVFPDLCNYDAIRLPSVADVKAHIKIERAKNGRKHTPLWDFGPRRPIVNAAYLLDIMTVFPDAAEIFASRNASLCEPLCIVSERGDGLLLPVRDKERTADSLLHWYAVSVQHDPDYAMQPDDFALLAAVAYRAA